MEGFIYALQEVQAARHGRSDVTPTTIPLSAGSTAGKPKSRVTA